MSTKETQKTMEKYIASAHTDVSLLTDDVVFTITATGQENHGPESVKQMFDYFYRKAFDAKAETHHTIFSDQHAVIEADFVGKHIGEFADSPATGKDVRVPLCVVYDLEANRIKRARVYFEMPALMQQLGVPAGP